MSRSEDDRAGGTRKRKRPLLNGESGANAHNDAEEEADLESEDDADRDETDETATPSGTPASGGGPVS